MFPGGHPSNYWSKKEKKEFAQPRSWTASPHAVTHPRTDVARSCLTSVIGLSPWEIAFPEGTRIRRYLFSNIWTKRIPKFLQKKVHFHEKNTHAVICQAFVVGDWQFNWNMKMDVYTKALANAFANAFTDSEIKFRRHFTVSSVNISRSVQKLLRKSRRISELGLLVAPSVVGIGNGLPRIAPITRGKKFHWYFFFVC